MYRPDALDNWSKGDRVITPLHGAGTVTGPEILIEDEKEKWTRRWGVKLDDSPAWYTDGIAYYWDRQLTREPHLT